MGQLAINSLKATCKPASTTTPRIVSWPSSIRIKRSFKACHDPLTRVAASVGMDNGSAGWADRCLEPDFISWFAEHDLRPGAKREGSDENDNHFGAAITTAADHETNKVEVGPRRVGRMHDRNGVGLSERITRAHKTPSPRQFGTGALLGTSGLSGIWIGPAGGRRGCKGQEKNRRQGEPTGIATRSFSSNWSHALRNGSRLATLERDMPIKL